MFTARLSVSCLALLLAACSSTTPSNGGGGGGGDPTGGGGGGSSPGSWLEHRQRHRQRLERHRQRQRFEHRLGGADVRDRRRHAPRLDRRHLELSDVDHHEDLPGHRGETRRSRSSRSRTGDYQYASTSGSEQMPAARARTWPRAPRTRGVVLPGDGQPRVHRLHGLELRQRQHRRHHEELCPTSLGRCCRRLGRRSPYYVENVQAADGSWTAKFVVVACNAWDSTQSSWLTTQLSDADDLHVRRPPRERRRHVRSPSARRARASSTRIR